MFLSLCKVLHGGRRSRASRTHQLGLLCLQNYTSMKLFSTASNQHLFTVSYLMSSCGFSQESALSISKHIQFESPERPDSVIALFKSHGFSKKQISQIILDKPRLLLSSVENTLSPKLKFFYSKGFSNTQLLHILSVCPRILTRSVENHLSPNFTYLSDLFQSSERTIAAIKHTPALLYMDLETSIAHNAGILRDNSVPEANVSKFLYYWPHSFLIKPDRFEEVVKTVKEMGISPLKIQFVLAIVAKTIMSNSLWERKLNVYQTWGWSDKEFLAAFRKYPWCMMASVDKIMAVMDFFVNKMGWDSSVISGRPLLITLSLEKRIIPRAAVLQFLLSKGLIDKKVTELISLFEYPEKTFLRRFVDSYDEAPQLLKLYQDKLDLSKKAKNISM